MATKKKRFAFKKTYITLASLIQEGRAQRLLNELKSSVEVLKSHQDLGELTTTLTKLIKETPGELEDTQLIISNTELIINSMDGICSDLNCKNDIEESEEDWLRSAQMTSTPKKGYKDNSDFNLGLSDSEEQDWSSAETQDSSSSTSTPSYFSSDSECLDSSSTESTGSSSSTLTEGHFSSDSEWVESSPSTSQEWAKKRKSKRDDQNNTSNFEDVKNENEALRTLTTPLAASFRDISYALENAKCCMEITVTKTEEFFQKYLLN
ncbi:hypothetical protein ACTXT7_011756 [Hymenolepis weldensis]